MNIIDIEIEKLKNFKRKEISKQLSDNVKENGQLRPILIDCDNKIVLGNTLVSAAELLGMEKIKAYKSYLKEEDINHVLSMIK